MARRLVLTALEGAIARADGGDANTLVAGSGWRARRAVRTLQRRLDRARQDVSGMPGADPIELRLAALHLAWLRQAGISPGAPIDGAGLRTRYYEALDKRRHRPPAVSRRRLRRIGRVPVVAILIGAGAAVVVALQPVPGPADGPVGEALVQHLPDWVVALDQWAPGARVAAATPAHVAKTDALKLMRAKVLSAELEAAIGAQAAGRLAELLDATQALAGEADVEGAGLGRDDAFRAALRAFNDELASGGLPYFLDGDWVVHSGDGHAMTVLFVFHVLARHELRAGGGEPVVAVHLRRLDTLSWVQLLLGYTRPGMKVAVVLLDKVEEQLVTYVGPALEPRALMPILPSGVAREPFHEMVERRAGQVARDTFYSALPSERAALTALGASLARRRDQFQRWRVRMSQKGIRLRDPGSLALSEPHMAELKEILPDYQVDALDELQDAVETGDNRAILDRMIDRHARSVEVHEVQHRIDYARGEAFPVPADFLAQIGTTRAPDGTVDARTKRGAYELSAYLAEIALQIDWAPLNLTLLTQSALDVGETVERHVGVVILAGLAEGLGLTVRPLIDGKVSRRAVAETYLALLDVEPASLCAAATKLWERWFADRLRRPERITPTLSGP